MRAPRLLVIQHEDDCPPAWFGRWWTEAGAELLVVRGHRGDPIPETAQGVDGVLVLGGEMGANDDATCAWLAPTKSLIARTVTGNVPFLGICLGHQLATVALGGRVDVNPAGPAVGLTQITLTDAALDDPLLGSVASGTPAIQWNNDIALELPDGATVLATAPDGSPQALRLGERAWSVQFHPEITAEVFRRWIADDTSTDAPSAHSTDSADDVRDPRAALAQIEAAQEQLLRDWQAFALRFLGLVQQARVEQARGA